MDARFEEALRRFDAENAADPNILLVNGREIPRELFYAERLSYWIARLDPNASEALKLAARCQHIRRWEIPRSAYPIGKAGYHKWRTALKAFHADLSGRILGECGYGPEMVESVQALNLKKNFPADHDSRTLEDGLCLVFLERQLGELAGKTAEEKVINALRKSWAKMTDNGRKLAMELPLGEPEKQLITKAIGLV
jgi:hypothetical protein